MLTVRTHNNLIKTRDDNKLTMAMLTMAMKTPEMLNMIMLTKR